MRRSTFHNIRYVHVSTFFEVLTDASIKELSHVRRLFSETAEGFEEVLQFLVRLRLVGFDNGNIQLKVFKDMSNDRLRRREIVNRLTANRNRYRSEVYQFLGRFKIIDGELVYLSVDQHRSADGPVRNFLAELGIVLTDIESQKHRLSTDYFGLFADALARMRTISKSQFDNRQNEKEEIGKAAEKVVLDYERSRVGKALAEKVGNIACKNTAAGFDILSVSKTENGIVPRFIEVKAVPIDDRRFYWTRKEIEVAQATSELYFLYLLPVIGQQRFDLRALEIIQNPYGTILKDKLRWITECETLVCRRKQG